MAYLSSLLLSGDTMNDPRNVVIHLHDGDLPDALDLGSVVAIDTETMGLNPHRDRLCLVQLSSGNGEAHLVQIKPTRLGGRGYDCPNLKKTPHRFFCNQADAFRTFRCCRLTA